MVAISFFMSTYSRIDQLAYERREKRLTGKLQKYLIELLFSEEENDVRPKNTL
ncbi:MAG: hypothetical protein ACJAUV_001293 [Flavobacteriales bacterium]|jgi:hypothetical protein